MTWPGYALKSRRLTLTLMFGYLAVNIWPACLSSASRLDSNVHTVSVIGSTFEMSVLTFSGASPAPPSLPGVPPQPATSAAPATSATASVRAKDPLMSSSLFLRHE